MTTSLEKLADKLLAIMNDTDFHSRVKSTARAQLNHVCYQMWHENEKLKFATWEQDKEGKYSLVYTWKEKDEKEKIN